MRERGREREEEGRKEREEQAGREREIEEEGGQERSAAQGALGVKEEKKAREGWREGAKEGGSY